VLRTRPPDNEPLQRHWPHIARSRPVSLDPLFNRCFYVQTLKFHSTSVLRRAGGHGSCGLAVPGTWEPSRATRLTLAMVAAHSLAHARSIRRRQLESRCAAIYAAFAPEEPAGREHADLSLAQATGWILNGVRAHVSIQRVSYMDSPPTPSRR
jgi:hypothetical protein